jgi:hypothetical protein
VRLRDSELGRLLVCESCGEAAFVDELDECGLDGNPLYDHSELQPGKCPGAGKKNREGFVQMQDGRCICMGCYCAETEPPCWDVTVERLRPTIWAHLADPDDPQGTERKTVRLGPTDSRFTFWASGWVIVNRVPVYD